MKIESRWPEYTDEEIAAVGDVLRSGKVNYWTGSEGVAFEREFAAYTGRSHALALHNGTLALELALRAFGIGPGDEVITTPRTFIATASAIVMVGATPVFADVDPDTQGLSPESVAGAVTSRTRAVIPVHLGGWPCDMDGIVTVADEHGLTVIEDCAQAHGATIDGRPVGGFGHAGAFSFCQDKIISTGGEGGMLVLDDEAAWKRAWAFRDHGKSFDAVHEREHPPGFRWLHESFGSNYRMTEMQSVIGRIQLRRLEETVAVRRRNAAILEKHLAGNAAVRLPVAGDGVAPSFYRFYLFLRTDRLQGGWSRDRIMEEANAAGVPCNVGSCAAVYRERAFGKTVPAPDEPLPNVHALGEASLALPVDPTLSVEQVESMGDTLNGIIEAASVVTS